MGKAIPQDTLLTCWGVTYPGERHEEKKKKKKKKKAQNIDRIPGTCHG